MHHPKLDIHYVLCMPWEREGYNDEDGLVIGKPREPLYSCLSTFIGLCSKHEQGLSLCLTGKLILNKVEKKKINEKFGMVLTKPS